MGEPSADAIVRLSRTVARGFTMRSHIDYDDLVQEATLRILEHLPKYDRTRTFTTWAWPYATGAIIDHLRKENAGGRTQKLYLGPHGVPDPVTVTAEHPESLTTPLRLKGWHEMHTLTLEDLLHAPDDTAAVGEASVLAARALRALKAHKKPDVSAAALRVMVLDEKGQDVAESMGVSGARVSQLVGEARRVMAAAWCQDV